MRRHFVSVAVMMLASVLLVHAQALGPDERYLGIYGMITEGDSLNAKGKLAEAAGKYSEAQSALKALQTAYPGWHEAVVKFRLEYTASKLEPLASAIATNKPAVQTNAPVLAEVVPGTQFKELKDQITQLTAQNAELQAKLKEALTVQPAAVDPRELAKAEEKIKQLEKERDLYKVSAGVKPDKPDDASPATEEKMLIAELKKKLAQQIEALASLQNENETLKAQVTALNKSRGGSTSNSELAQELTITKMTLAALQETNIALRADAIVKEKQLEEITKKGDTVPKSLYQSLEKERDDLKDKLESATRKLQSRPGSASSAEQAELARQLEAAQAKLAAYENKPVPFTPEELALIKQPDLKVTVSAVADPARKKKVPVLPAGAAPLMAEGERAMVSGKFDEAEKKFQDVLRQDENNQYVLTHLAAAQMDQNHLDDAAKTLEKARTVDPKDPATLLLLGQLCFFQQKYDEAFGFLSLSAQILPDDPRTQYFLGKVLLQKGNRAPAEAALRKAVQLRPGWGDAHYLLAFIYATQKPAFLELARWHYFTKALPAGYPRNQEFEKILDQDKTTSNTTK